MTECPNMVWTCCLCTLYMGCAQTQGLTPSQGETPYKEGGDSRGLWRGWPILEGTKAWRYMNRTLVFFHMHCHFKEYCIWSFWERFSSLRKPLGVGNLDSSQSWYWQFFLAKFKFWTQAEMEPVSSTLVSHLWAIKLTLGAGFVIRRWCSVGVNYTCAVTVL